MSAVGTAGGAGTVVNAMATGRGCAFGLRLRVEARVRPDERWSVFSGGRRLALSRARLAFEAARRVPAGGRTPGPLRIDIRSEIPPERGLKSSSAIAVAVIRACLRHQGRRWSAGRILEAAAEAGLASGTSLTGAFDDAAACLLGGVVVTDNTRRQIVRRFNLPSRLSALVHVPKRRLPTAQVRGTRFDGVRPIVDEAWNLARRGEIRDAMLLNTTAYAPLFGHRARFTLDALAAGAFSAGLSGKGPAEIALGTPAVLRTLRGRYPRARLVPLRPGGPS